jgi:serine/threonine protein kinase
MQHGPEASGLQSWIEASLRDNLHILAAGYQGKTLEYRDADYHLVIKVPHGKGLRRYMHTLMLRHEHKVYQQLDDVKAVPKCFGMIANTYLVLEYVNASPIRNRRPENTEKYFKLLLQSIRTLHAHRVAHMDLKKKDNLLVTVDDTPCIIDLGAAVIYRPGLHPFNHFRYALAKRFDINAWVKHKYHNNEQNMSAEDRALYQRTFIERLAKSLKSIYLKTLSGR